MASCRAGPAAQPVGRQAQHQHPQRAHGAVLHQPHGGIRHHVDGTLDVAGGQRMRHRLVDVGVGTEPGARRPVQLGLALGRLALESALQVGREEVVVAVPLTVLVERLDEQVLLVQPFQHRLAAGQAAHRGAKACAQAIEDRGGQQEIEHVGRQAVQHVLGQVLPECAVVGAERRGHVAEQAARQPRRRALGIDRMAQRQRGQLQGRHPAFGAGPQRLHGRRVEAQCVHLAEEGLRLRHGEPQIGGGHLAQLAGHAQRRQRQRGPLTARDHHMEPPRGVFQQRHHRVTHLAVDDQVPVVDDDVEVALGALEGVDQLGHDDGGPPARAGLRADRPRPRSGRDRPRGPLRPGRSGSGRSSCPRATC